MATTAKCGSSGSISLGGEITSWELNLEEEIPEATSMLSAGYKEYIPCLKSASGTFETLIPCGAIGFETGVDFVNDIETITCDIIITDISLKVDVNDKVVFSYSWISTGSVSIA